MAAHFDRVKETSTTTGTGDQTLGGAVAGFRSFGSVYAVGEEHVPYCIRQSDDSEWEVGEGTYVSTNTLRRDRVIANSAGTLAKINFSAGTKDVFVNLSAETANIHGRVLAAARGYISF
jgi:hypothetical protein